MLRALLLTTLLIVSAQSLATAQPVVLVVRADSNVADLDSVTVRKLFLGLPVLIDGAPLHPVRNRSDALLDSIFLQQIVAMSQSVYEHCIVNEPKRRGWGRPAEFTTAGRVLDALYTDRNAVSFMWLSDAEHNPKVRIIRLLWSN